MAKTIQDLSEWCTRQDQNRLRDNEQRAHELNATNKHIADLKELVEELTKSVDIQDNYLKERVKTLEEKFTAHKNEIATLMQAHQNSVSKQLKPSLRDFLTKWLN